LPASMCAMIPMLRVFSRGKVRGMSVVVKCCFQFGSEAAAAPSKAPVVRRRQPA
jgi:hypothetical protein